MAHSTSNSVDSQILTELTPVKLVGDHGEVTEAKVPYSSGTTHIVKQELDTSSYTVFGEGSVDDLDIYDQPEHKLYMRFQSIFRGLPKEMFINRIIQCASSSEPDLENHRSMLFELVKECDEFPFGLQAELKRRVRTRNGDSVVSKLAHDVYILMSVLEGGEFSELKDIIAKGKSNRTQSQAQTPLRASYMASTSCGCSTEVAALLSNINNVKADVLSMKQSYAAVETTRSSEIQALKSTVLGLKADLSKLSTTVSKAVTDIALAAQRIDSDKSNGVAKLRTDIRLLKDSVRDIQDSLDSVNSLSTSSNTSVFGKSKKTAKKNKVSLNPVPSSTVNISEQSLNSVPVNEQSVGLAEHVPTYVAQEVDSAINENPNNGGQLNISREHLTAEPERTSVRHNMTSGVDAGHVACGTEGPFQYCSVGAVSEGSSTSVGPNVARPIPWVNAHGVDRPSLLQNSGAHSVENSTSNEIPCSPRETQSFSYRESLEHNGLFGRGNANFEQASNIPVLTARRAPNEPDAFVLVNEPSNKDDDDDADFIQYVKRKPRRYYLGGFYPEVTEDVIEHYVSKRGPTVSFVRIWHSKRNKRDVVIRLNIEDNGSADLVETPTFWPRGVRCRPWLDRNERYHNHNKTHRYHRHTPYVPRVGHAFGRSDVDDYNPFSPLRDQGNYHNTY